MSVSKKILIGGLSAGAALIVGYILWQKYHTPIVPVSGGSTGSPSGSPLAGSTGSPSGSPLTPSQSYSVSVSGGPVGAGATEVLGPGRTLPTIAEMNQGAIIQRISAKNFLNV